MTDDAKCDWWRDERGETLGPRPELIEEFAKETNGKWLYLYSTEMFLKHAKDYLEAAVTPETIKEARDIKKHDARQAKKVAENLSLLEGIDTNTTAQDSTLARLQLLAGRKRNFSINYDIIRRLFDPNTAEGQQRRKLLRKLASNKWILNESHDLNAPNRSEQSRTDTQPPPEAQENS